MRPFHFPRHKGHQTISAIPTLQILQGRYATPLLTLLLAGSLFSSATLAAETVNINTADAATIERVLVNIGPAKAEAIIAYRKANGAFRSVEQLALVKGVGLKTIEKNRDRILVAGGAASRKPVTAVRGGPATTTARSTPPRAPARK